MTTTPIIWKSPFFPNIERPAGNQSVPQTIGLKNGNILTVWEDDTQGPGPGIDVMGRFVSPEGLLIGAAAFQVNVTITTSDETGPKIAAMPDGGFVMAYGSWDAFLGGFIVVERFNSTGGSLSYRTILDDRSSLTNFEITADSLGNYTVVFEQREVSADGDDSINIHAITYDRLSNDAGTEQVHTAQNNPEDDDDLAAVASFANGHIITLATDPDDAFDGSPSGTVEFTITDPGSTPAPGSITHQPTQIAGSPGVFGNHDDADALDVAVLAGGQFVMLFKQTSFTQFSGTSHGFFMRISAGEAPGSAIAPAIAIVPNAQGFVVGNAYVVALPDGGFYVAWDNNGAILGARFDVEGTPVGETVRFQTGQLKGGLSLTSDGRILVPFTNAAGEIAEIILDPRESVIYGTGLGEILTTQVFGTDIFGEGGDDTIYGQAGNDFIYGGAARDDLRGGGGADTLFGEAGIDVLRGGAGDDSYMLDDANEGLFPDVKFYDTVSESAGQGTDTVFVKPLDVQSAVFQTDGYTLTDNVENGVITGPFDKFLLKGNSLDNRLTGDLGNDALNGLAGRDTLDGKVGTDTMSGGDGDDLFYVDNAGDIVNEFNGGGSDRVLASLSYALPGGVGGFIEKLTTTNNIGTGAINLTGNNFGNTIYGNAGANILDGKGAADTLVGLGGNDTFYVDDAGDVVVEGAGEGLADRALASVSYVLGAAAQVEKLTTTDNAGIGGIALTGNGFANTIFGNAGANTLDGAAGADTLIGLGGDDRFMVDNAGDVVVEAAGEGSDQVFASVDYALGAGRSIETLSTTSSSGLANLTLIGNELGNLVMGNAGSNALKGLAGNDTLYGGGGADAFAFNTALNAGTNVDRILDFTPVDDDIILASGVFTGIAAGTLTPGAFATGAAAAETDDRIIYNSATGALSYDPDGVGGVTQIQFAGVSAGLALTNADFIIV